MTPPDTATASPDIDLAEPSRNSFWALVRESLRGARHDFTALPLGRAILLLAVPMVLEMAMESIFAVADMFWVAKLGPDAISAVMLTESMLILIYAFAMGLAMGAAAVVARRIGEKDPHGAARASVQAIALGVGLAFVVGLIGALAAPHLLSAMGASTEVIAIGTRFTRVMLGGSVTVILLFLINACFRGAGDPTVAMRTLILANGINIVLGPLLVFGVGPFPRMGVTGAAVATTIGRGIGVLYQLRALRLGRGHLAVRREHLRIDTGIMSTIVRLSGSAIFQSFIGTTSWVALIRIVTRFGSVAVGGYGIAMRVVLFALLPSWGMANAAATLVGQNLGAGRPDRAEQAVWRAALYNLVFLGGTGALFIVFGNLIVRGFSPDPAVISYGTQALRIISAGFLFYAYGMVLTQAFNGAGDTRTPTYINLFCFWLWEIPLAWLLAGPLGFGPTGVFIAVLIGFSTMAVVSVVMFRRGRWKRVTV